jgi:hypothetical protein
LLLHFDTDESWLDSPVEARTVDPVDPVDPVGAAVRDAVLAGPFAADTVPDNLAEQVLTRITDRDLLDVVIDKAGRRQIRDRSLPSWIVIHVVLALCLFSSEGYGSVLRQIWPALTRLRGRPVPVPDPSALPRARRRVGAAPLAALFDHLRGPAATPDTPGAFRFGLRVMAIDGTTLNVPDSADNDAVYDRHTNGTTTAKTPQVRLTLLIECATHAIHAARFDGTQTSEHTQADHLISELQPGMLLLADRNYHSYNRWHTATTTGAHLLWRIKHGHSKGTVKLPIQHPLPDGSYLSVLHEPNSARRTRSRHTGVGTSIQRRHPPLTVRVIDYTVTVTLSNNTTRTETYRLLTTILDPDHATATELAACYHERWEAETAYGHLKTRLHGPHTTLRSHHPDTVTQEIWAYLCIYQTLCHLAATAAHHTGLDPDRISFTVTLRELRRTLTNPTEHPPHQLLHRITQQALPNRRNRISNRQTKKPGRKRRSWTATFTVTIQPHPSH